MAQDARYRDNFLVVAHPHDNIVENFEFQEEIVDEEPVEFLRYQENTGLWKDVPTNHRTSSLTILPSLDIDCDSDNNVVIERSDGEEENENHANYPGKIIAINNDDDNGNGESDMDEVDTFGNPTVYTSADDDLTEAILDFGLSTYAGLDGCTLELTCTAGLRIWGDQLRNIPSGTSVYNLANSLYVWNITTGMTSNPFPSSVYVEGIAAGRQSVTWAILDPQDQVLHSDTVVFTVGLGLHSVDLEATDAARKHEITQDTGTLYGDVEWIDDNLDGKAENTQPGEQCYPVCYTRSGPHGDVKVKVEEVKFKMLGDLGSISVEVTAVGTIGDQAITFGVVTATEDSGYMVASDLISPTAIPDTIENSEIILNWKVRIDGGAWIGLGQSVNTAYITWDNPTTSAPFETCLYIGCKAGDGTGGKVGGPGHADPADDGIDISVLEDIWNDGFTGLDAARVDGTKLKYYNPMLTTNVTTASLLLNANGQCGSWAKLFIDVLKAQGLYTNYSSPTAPSYADNYAIVEPVSGYADGFIVKDWDFAAGPGLSGMAAFPYLNIIDTNLPAGDHSIDRGANAYKMADGSSDRP